MFLIDYVLLVQIEQPLTDNHDVSKNLFDFVFIATEDVVKALEGAAQPSRRTKVDWIKLGLCRHRSQ